MSALDTINANGQDYDIMSPEVVSDYVEKIGTICKNPNGYTKGSLFLARDAQNVERMYKATSAIASNQTITSGTNCTVKKLGDLFNDVDSDVSQLKQALSDEQNIYGAKNILDFSKLAVVNPFVQNKITYTFHQDTGIINIVSDGTSTGSVSPYCYLPIYSENTDVIVSVEGIDSSKNDYLVYDYTASTTLIYGTTEKTTTLPANHLVGITIRSYNNKTYNETIKLMVRRCGDSTFVPFAKGNIELTKDDSGLTANAFENGAVNELNHVLTSQVVTSNGANLTVVVDSEKTVTISGTTGTAVVQLILADNYHLSAGKYHYSGCPSGGGATSYYMGWRKNGVWQSMSDLGSGADLTGIASTDALQFLIVIPSGVTISTPVKFKPMITVADMPNSDYNHYVPYRMSNGELTEIALGESSDWLTNVKLYKRGNVVFCSTSGTDITVSAIKAAIIPNGFRPINSVIIAPYIKSGSSRYLGFMTIGSNGAVGTLGSVSNGSYTDASDSDTVQFSTCWITA